MKNKHKWTFPRLLFLMKKVTINSSNLIFFVDMKWRSTFRFSCHYIFVVYGFYSFFCCHNPICHLNYFRPINYIEAVFRDQYPAALSSLIRKKKFTHVWFSSSLLRTKKTLFLKVILDNWTRTFEWHECTLFLIRL